MGLRTISILNSFLHLFSTFRQRLRATKLVTLNLWRVGRVKRQGRSAIRDHWILLSQDTVLFNLRSKQCSVTIRSAEHRIQGGVKFGQLKGSSSRYSRTITPQGVKPQKQNVQNFLEKTKFPKSKKALQRYLGFLNYYRNYVPRLAERLAPFYKMLKSDEKVLVSKELVQQFEDINKALDKCCDLALQQPIPNKQIALMTDASFGAAGYAVLIEDDPNQKFTSLRKSYAPVAYGSKTFTPAQIKMSIYAKEFLAIYFAFKEFGHIFWGAPKPVIILTDNKAVTRFFQTKIIPPALWNACEYVIQFCHSAYPGGTKHSCRLFVPIGSRSEGQTSDENSRRCTNTTDRNQCPICRGVTRRTNLLHQ